MGLHPNHSRLGEKLRTNEYRKCCKAEDYDLPIVDKGSKSQI